MVDKKIDKFRKSILEREMKMILVSGGDLKRLQKIREILKNNESDEDGNRSE